MVAWVNEDYYAILNIHWDLLFSHKTSLRLSTTSALPWVYSQLTTQNIIRPWPSNTVWYLLLPYSILPRLDYIFWRCLINLFLDKGTEGEREGEKHQCVVASCVPCIGNLACNPGMCPDWEWNLRPFISQASPQPTEPHHLGLNYISWRLIKVSAVSLFSGGLR